MTVQMLRWTLEEKDFRELCRGGRVTLTRMGGEPPVVEILLADVGWPAMLNCIGAAIDTANHRAMQQQSRLNQSIADSLPDPEQTALECNELIAAGDLAAAVRAHLDKPEGDVLAELLAVSRRLDGYEAARAERRKYRRTAATVTPPPDEPTPTGESPP